MRRVPAKRSTTDELACCRTKRNIIAARPAYATNVVVKKPTFPAKDLAPEGECVQTPMCFVDWLATFSLRMAVGAMTTIPVELFI